MSICYTSTSGSAQINMFIKTMRLCRDIWITESLNNMLNLDEEKIEFGLGNKDFWHGKKPKNVIFLTSGFAVFICLWLLALTNSNNLINHILRVSIIISTWCQTTIILGAAMSTAKEMRRVVEVNTTRHTRSSTCTIVSIYQSTHLLAQRATTILRLFPCLMAKVGMGAKKGTNI